jgi:hypothetical protein
MMLLAVTFAKAQDTPTPPPEIFPKIMIIHMKDSTSDSIKCSRLDMETGITFDRFEMKVAVKDIVEPILDPWALQYTHNTLHYCLGQIDSITFMEVHGAAAKRVAPGLASSSRQQAAAKPVQWNSNPLFAAPKK